MVYAAELYLNLNDTVYKTSTDRKGEFKFKLLKSKSIAQLYISTTNKTVCSDVKKSSFLSNPMTYKINLAEKIEYNYDFELKTVNIDYSTPSIIFSANTSSVVTDVKYGKTSAKIDEVMEYFSGLCKQHPKMILDIEGMVSSTEKGDGLSLSRAKYIAGLLIAKGVPAANLKTKACGTDLPEIPLNVIVKEKSKAKQESMHAANARVTIKILKPGEEIPDKEGAHF